MELAKLEKLLEKYDEGVTTLKEEQILSAYFKTEYIPPHLASYKILFSYFNESKQEAFVKPITLETKKPKKQYVKWLSYAASIALLISVFIGRQEYVKHQEKKQLAQIKEALLLVSKNLNKGNNALFTVSENLNKGNQALLAVSTNINKGNKAFSSLNIYEDTVYKIFKDQ